MKKIVIVLAAGIMALALAGCGNGRATSEEAVAQLANPWEEVNTLKAAEETVGFEVQIPASITLDDSAVYRVCAALNEIEVQFADGYLRKAKDDGDISGDYNEYPEVTEADVDGNKVTLKGNSADSCNLAVWLSGDYSYCIGYTNGISPEEMKKLAGELK